MKCLSLYIFKLLNINMLYLDAYELKRGVNERSAGLRPGAATWLLNPPCIHESPRRIELAKRLECGRLAAAVASSESGSKLSKLAALQTLRDVLCLCRSGRCTGQVLCVALFCVALLPTAAAQDSVTTLAGQALVSGISNGFR